MDSVDPSFVNVKLYDELHPCTIWLGLRAESALYRLEEARRKERKARADRKKDAGRDKTAKGKEGPARKRRRKEKDEDMKSMSSSDSHGSELPAAESESIADTDTSGSSECIPSPKEPPPLEDIPVRPSGDDDEPPAIHPVYTPTSPASPRPRTPSPDRHKSPPPVETDLEYVSIWPSPAPTPIVEPTGIYDSGSSDEDPDELLKWAKKPKRNGGNASDDYVSDFSDSDESSGSASSPTSSSSSSSSSSSASASQSSGAAARAPAVDDSNDDLDGTAHRARGPHLPRMAEVILPGEHNHSIRWNFISDTFVATCGFHRNCSRSRTCGPGNQYPGLAMQITRKLS